MPGTQRSLGPSPRLFERLYGIVEQRIAQGQLTPGDRLLEAHLAAEFAVSRAPARRALERLAKAGLVEKTDGRGYTVCRCDTPLLPVAPEPSTSGRLISTTTWQRIYGEVEREVVARAAFGAWRITEVDLGQHYRVSRTVAREVLARLQQVGIVKKDQRSRWYVPALTPRRFRELYEMRRILEPIALQRAALRVEPGRVATMREDLERAITRFPDVESRELDRLERALHIDLLAYCDNGTLVETLQHYHALLIVHGYIYALSPETFTFDPFLADHLAVVHALQAGRTEDAATALERHLAVSVDRAVGRIAFIVGHREPDPLSYLTMLPEEP